MANGEEDSNHMAARTRHELGGFILEAIRGVGLALAGRAWSFGGM